MDTAEGSKWAAKNPQKAETVMSLKRRFGGCRSNDKNQPENEYILSCSTLSSNDVILDTGATHHIFCDSSLFTSMVPVRKSIETASGRVEPVSWSGSVSFEIDYVSGVGGQETYKERDWGGI